MYQLIGDHKKDIELSREGKRNRNRFQNSPSPPKHQSNIQTLEKPNKKQKRTCSEDEEKTKHDNGLGRQQSIVAHSSSKEIESYRSGPRTPPPQTTVNVRQRTGPRTPSPPSKESFEQKSNETSGRRESFTPERTTRGRR